MRGKPSWTAREPDGVKREVRVAIDGRTIKWQFKRADMERWDYAGKPEVRDWDALVDMLTRRSGRAMPWC